MRAAEEAYPGYPDTIPELMERAGAGVAYEAMRVFPYAGGSPSSAAAAPTAATAGWPRACLREAGREAVETDVVEGADVVVDALFGTGFHGTPRPEAAALIDRINGCGAPVVAVDVPSGVDASTGEVPGAAVDAALTVTFHTSKVGLHVAPGRFHAGDVAVVDIGLGETRRRCAARLPRC
jgi:NAD(P)H-hydrate repair Nnr-like enzyme with NAD(P)H-hydrate epimerase domain